MDDRHVFDGEWEFAGEFGTAEVVSADSTSNGAEPAHWFIDYEGTTRVVITDLLPDGYTLIDVECVARSDSQDWEVDGSSVIWFPPWQAFGPSGFDCEFIHGAEEVGVEIVARKVIDADGDPGSIDDQTAGEGWEFDLELTNGDIDQAFPITSSDGFAGWLIRVGPGGTLATVSEMGQDGFALVDVTCVRISEAGEVTVGDLDNGHISFQIEEGEAASYQCDFINVPTDVSRAGISVWKLIDTDGDLGTFEDIVWPRSWQFEATFDHGVEILFAEPETNRDEPAGWLIGHTGDSTRVVVTEIPQPGYRLAKASCIDAESDVGVEIPTTLDGNSLSFEVSGFSPVAPFDHAYFCSFVNVPVGDAALPTLPPTDVGDETTRHSSPLTTVVLVLLAAVVAVLVTTRHRKRDAR